MKSFNLTGAFLALFTFVALSATLIGTHAFETLYAVARHHADYGIDDIAIAVLAAVLSLCLWLAHSFARQRRYAEFSSAMQRVLKQRIDQDRRFRTYFDELPIAVVVFDTASRTVVYENDVSVALFGPFGPNPCDAERSAEIFHPADCRRFRNYLCAKNHAGGIRLAMRRKSGGEGTFIACAQPVDRKTPHIVVCTLTSAVG